MVGGERVDQSGVFGKRSIRGCSASSCSACARVLSSMSSLTDFRSMTPNPVPSGEENTLGMLSAARDSSVSGLLSADNEVSGC